MTRTHAAPTAPQASRPGRTETVLTARGIGMIAGGLVITALGIGMASLTVVVVGLVLVVGVAAGALWLQASIAVMRRRYRSASRTISPHPLTAGADGRVEVVVMSRRSQRHVPRLDVREQAASELTGDGSTSATVLREPGRVTLTYSLSPVARGTWPLGPAVARVADPLGTLWADTPIGAEQDAVVWPRVVDLSRDRGAALAGSDRSLRGATSPATDDAALREYRHGDDPRRVHWKSSARRGELVVRADEHASRPSVTVILDAAGEPDAAEDAIGIAGSVALASLASGHAVRLLGAGLDESREYGARAPESRSALLTALALVTASTPDGPARLADAARTAAHEVSRGGIAIAVVNPRSLDDSDASDAMAGLGGAGTTTALLVGEDAALVSRLARAGWRVGVTPTLADLPAAWSAALRGIAS